MPIHYGDRNGPFREEPETSPEPLEERPAKTQLQQDRRVRIDRMYEQLKVLSGGEDFRNLDLSTESSREYWEEVLRKRPQLSNLLDSLRTSSLIEEEELLATSRESDEYLAVQRQNGFIKELLEKFPVKSRQL